MMTTTLPRVLYSGGKRSPIRTKDTDPAGDRERGEREY